MEIDYSKHICLAETSNCEMFSLLLKVSVFILLAHLTQGSQGEAIG